MNVLTISKKIDRLKPAESIDISTIRRKAKGIEIEFRELRNDEKLHLSKARKFLNVKESDTIEE
ncbi:40316_t:CDS:1, partial [Gigaspora margarita]